MPRVAVSGRALGRYGASEHPGPVVPSGDLAVLLGRCVRPTGTVQVTYPGTPGHYMMLLERGGAFHLRGRAHDLVVDPATCVIGRAGEAADVTHPFGTGDRGTFVVLAPSLLAELGADGRDVPATAHVSGVMARLHFRLVTSVVRGDDLLDVEETALRLFELALSGSRAPRTPDPGRTGNAQRRLVEQASAILAADLTADSIIDLSFAVGCSPSYLSRSFRQLLGRTMSQHRVELRVHRALELLTAGEPRLSTVAALAGFADHAHMTRSFRRFLGAAPSQVRHLSATA